MKKMIKLLFVLNMAFMLGVGSVEDAKAQSANSQTVEQTDPEPEKKLSKREQCKADMRPSIPEVRAGFEEWLYREIYPEALKRDISKETLDDILPTVEFNENSYLSDNCKAEWTIDVDDYRDNFLNSYSYKKGKAALRTYERTLEELYEKHQVAPHYLMALFGIESGYGRTTGDYRILDGTATVAYTTKESSARKKRRKEQFVTYFIDTIRLIDRKDMKPEQQGGYLGASGIFQFMPSNIALYAVDGDHDGRVDFWENPRDALASAANFLDVYCKWTPGERVGRRVKLPDNLDKRFYGRNNGRSVREWAELGVNLENGDPIPAEDMDAFLVILEYHYLDDDLKQAYDHLPNGDEYKAYLGYRNARSIMRWNFSHLFWTTVSDLSDQFREPAAPIIHKARKPTPQ